MRSGVWHFRTQEVAEGARVFSAVEFQLRFKYLYLVPLLLLFWRSSMRKDLESLKRVLETDCN